MYFKDIDDLEFPDKSIEEFKVRLENEIGHYCGSYENIDTIKLRILLTLNCDSVALNDGFVTLQDQIIPNIDITNVSEYANNIKLSNLWNEQNHTSKKLSKIEYDIKTYDKDKHRKNKLSDQSDFLKDKLKEIDKKISEIERNIFNLSLDLCKDKLHQKMPADIIYAYRQFELGDYEEVLSILSAENIRMVSVARACGASAKFTGSGGAIVGVYEGEEMFNRLTEELAKISVKVIKPEMAPFSES